ncbi:hypothetical protein HRbin16_03201 [bacterium HR16]|nr:hypothetical protein HRbin16_03201 [bacterium HR16]
MPHTIKIKTTVLPGRRIEVFSPDLQEGEQVELLIVRPSEQSTHPVPMLQLVERLPEGPRSAVSWEELERALNEEKAAWER